MKFSVFAWTVNHARQRIRQPKQGEWEREREGPLFSLFIM